MITSKNTPAMKGKQKLDLNLSKEAHLCSWAQFLPGQETLQKFDTDEVTQQKSMQRKFQTAQQPNRDAAWTL